MGPHNSTVIYLLPISADNNFSLSGRYSCQFLSVSRYILIIADIFRVTVDIFQ